MTLHLPHDWQARLDAEGYLRLGRLMTDEQLERLRGRIAEIIARRDEWTQFRVQAEPKRADALDRGEEVPWRKIVGLRNLLAHGYWVIDAEELWDVARNKVPEFVAELRPLLGDAN